MPDVVSHRLKRTMHGALAATVIASTVTMTSAPALAEPDPAGNASETVKRYRDISREAEKTNEDKKKADEDHAAKQAEAERAAAAVAPAEQAASAARDEEQRYRGTVDQMTRASYEGARMNNLSALVASKSPRDYLNRASALNVLAQQKKDVVDRLSAARSRAEAAEKRAQDNRDQAQRAEADAARLQQEIAQKEKDLQAQGKQALDEYQRLTGADKASLAGDTFLGKVLGAGEGAEAARLALQQQNKPYVWGATGPNAFDCSGLTQWAYKQVGIDIGRSTRNQVTTGRSVSENELQPGDLIFYYSSNSHVAMYLGQGKAVHASEPGEPVKVSDYKKIGSVNTIKRPVG